MRHQDRDAYQAWLVGELLLVGLLGAALGLFLAYPDLQTSYELPNLRLVLDVAMMLAATIVAVLAGIRFSVEGRRLDLVLCAGFFASAVTGLLFGVGPVLGGAPVPTAEAWAGVGGRMLSLALIAAAPLARGRMTERRWVLR
ncbi:MAG: hypothetical protein M3310_05785, partial [Actinomycetota bacterium]|nr:hypothetical protein [Actinomycetota bacterium]